ncbi:putative RNA-directed DNA polymerase from transposon BS [Labeo rohita]|uniref:RNA-directed DNA polymerase from transposon BS n=1 Tax=Labeo rohita TaxID=84645 RepID=A0ABQ8L1Q6_LABRO|nr:putative RNA-directed DNA polymerase from transposon BS [Labeo rohita]
MCFQYIPVISTQRSNITRRRQRNLTNLRPIVTSSTETSSFTVGLWNCQSAVNKADFISAFSTHSTLSILGLTETWIRPEDCCSLRPTPAALSNNFSFSHTPRHTGRGGGQHGPPLLTLGYPMFSKLRAAERKWHKSKDPSDLITRYLFKTFNSLLCPPAPPPTTSITADDFATFFTDKTISSQFSAPHVQELIQTTSTANTPLFSFCPLSEAEVSTLLLSSHPTTCPLDPIPSHLLQAISPTLLPALTHIINTSLLTGTFPTAFKQARQKHLNESFLTRYHCFSHRTVHWMLTSQGSGVATQLKLHYCQSLKPCGLQKLTPDHQYSFCCIFLLLLTQSIIRSSCPPSHHWVSQGFLFAGLNPISQVGLSGWPGEGRYPKHIIWPLGFLRDQFLDPSSSPFTLHHWGPSYRHMACLTMYLSCYADDTQLYLSFQPDDPTVAARISGCLVDISEWMKEHHLQLNLAKTELLIFPATLTLQHDFTINLGTLTITSSSSARNLGVIFDDQLTFKDHIAKTARSCRFALHNIRKIRPFLTEQATQLLVQALVISRLDYCNALLAGLPSCTIKRLQMIQNAAARLVFNEPKRAHVTPLFITLHWLPIAARIKFKTLMLAYRTIAGSVPAYLHSLLPIYTPSRTLRSASERRLIVPSHRGTFQNILLHRSWLVE